MARLISPHVEIQATLRIRSGFQPERVLYLLSIELIDAAENVLPRSLTLLRMCYHARS